MPAALGVICFNLSSNSQYFNSSIQLFIPFKIPNNEMQCVYLEVMATMLNLGKSSKKKNVKIVTKTHYLKA